MRSLLQAPGVHAADPRTSHLQIGHDLYDVSCLYWNGGAGTGQFTSADSQSDWTGEQQAATLGDMWTQGAHRKWLYEAISV